MNIDNRKHIDFVFTLITGLSFGYRTFLANNYIRLNAGKKGQTIKAFFDDNPLWIIFVRAFMIIPFKHSDNIEAERLRNKINILTYVIYMGFGAQIILSFL